MAFEQTDANPAESSTAEVTEPNAAATAATEGSTDANAAASSTVDEGAKPASLLDVVKDAIKKDEPAAAESPAAEGEGEPKPAEADPEAKTPEEQEEADKKLPFHEHPRWKEVIAERDGYREDAGRFREIEGFMQTHGLTGDEVAEGFDIMAKLKSGTPESLTEAREYFATRLAFLDDALGNVLPDDLRQKVEAGEINEDAAKETARLRAETKLRTAHDERRQEVDDQTRARETAIANAQACATAVDEWEGRQKAADPDYARKAALVEMTCRAIVQETGQPPRNPQESVALAEKAYARVNEQFKALQPKPQPVRRAPTGSSAPTVTEPKTLRDAVRAALSASR